MTIALVSRALRAYFSLRIRMKISGKFPDGVGKVGSEGYRPIPDEDDERHAVSEFVWTR